MKSMGEAKGAGAMTDNPIKTEIVRRKRGEVSIETLSPETREALADWGRRKIAKIKALAKVEAMAAGEMEGIDWRFVDAKIERGRRGHDNVDNLTWESETPIWEAIRDALRLYHTPGNTQPFPVEMALELAHAINTLLTGHQPYAFRALRKRPGKRLLPEEYDAIRHGVMYMRACDAGLIDDKSSRRTIFKWFGGFGELNIRTVQYWLKAPQNADVSVESFRQDLRDDDRARLIATLARKSGELYGFYKGRSKTWDRPAK